MSDPQDGTGSPFAMWDYKGMTGTDGEFFARAASILELGTGLHHLAVMADRYVADHDQLSATDVADASRAAQAVAPDLRQRVARELGNFTDAYKRRIENHLDHLDPESIGPQVDDPFQWIAAQLAETIRESLDDARGLLSGVPLDEQELGSYLLQYSQALERRPLLPTMQRALLITAVASVETMLIGVLRRIQYDQGGADRWGSMLNTPRLDRQVRRLTRGSIEDWVPRVREDLGVDLPAASCDWDSVREIWARRHALVHNRGIADAMYVARILSAVEGTTLEVDGEYLRNAIDLLCGFVLGVILTVWATLPDRGAFVIQFTHMYAAAAEAEFRWPLAENLHVIAARAERDVAFAAANQVNAWLARTHWRAPDSVLDAVRAWRTDELPRRFTVARLILLGECDAAIRLLPDALQHGDLTKDNLITWPLFDRLRGMADFERLLASD